MVGASKANPVVVVLVLLCGVFLLTSVVAVKRIYDDVTKFGNEFGSSVATSALNGIAADPPPELQVTSINCAGARVEFSFVNPDVVGKATFKVAQLKFRGETPLEKLPFTVIVAPGATSRRFFISRQSRLDQAPWTTNSVSILLLGPAVPASTGRFADNAPAYLRSFRSASTAASTTLLPSSLPLNERVAS